jgi:hypothetical protein
MTYWVDSCTTFQGALAVSLDSCSNSGGHLTIYRSDPSKISDAMPKCSGEIFMQVALSTTCQFSMLFNAFVEVGNPTIACFFWVYFLSVGLMCLPSLAGYRH